MTEKIFKPMRSAAPDPKYPILYPKLASPKLDGIRACIYDGKAVTKSGKPVPNNHIRTWLEANVPEGVDGELISGDPTLESCYGTTFSAVMTQAGTPVFSFYVFDLCDRKEDAASRRAQLKMICRDLDIRVIFVPQTEVFNDAEVEALYDRFLVQGYEGMILVDPYGHYKYGKSSPRGQEQLKLKPHADSEGEILDTHEAMQNDNEAFINDVGETKRSQHVENKSGKGMIGGYTVRDVVTNNIFKVGAGKMKHDERLSEWQAFMADPQHRMGTYLKYRSMSYGTMTNGGARHGRWIGWRAVVDMNPEDVKGIA